MNTQQKKFNRKYGYDWPKDWPMARIERACLFNREVLLSKNASLKAPIDHAREAVLGHFVDTQWSEWSEEMFSAFISNEFLTMTGPASSGKSRSVAHWALLSFYEWPIESAFFIVSVNLEKLKKSSWAECERGHNQAQKLLGPSICPGKVYAGNSPKIQVERKMAGADFDGKTGIHGICVSITGGAVKGIDSLTGVHVPRVKMLMDEMNSCLPAAFQAYTDNLSVGKKQRQFIGFANGGNLADLHGINSKPVDGWPSVMNSIWENKGQPKNTIWQTERGACLHLDGLTSPSLRNPKKFSFHLTKKDIAERARNGGDKSPAFWRFVRGIWPPGDGGRTLLTFAGLSSSMAQAVISESETKEIIISSLDPSFGGEDECILTIGKIAMTKTIGGKDRLRLVLEPPISVKVEAHSQRIIHQQTAKAACEIWRKRAMIPDKLAIDITTEGQGVFEWVERELGFGVLGVDFAGAASENPVSFGDAGRAKDRYANRTTEAWAVVKLLAEHDQLRGLSSEAVVEFTSREYDVKNQGKIQLQSKKEVKVTLGRSPDRADGTALICLLAKERFGLLPGQDTERPSNKNNALAFQKLREKYFNKQGQHLAKALNGWA